MSFRMLDDFAHEMDTTDSKMDNVMKKMAKVMHMSSGKPFTSGFHQTRATG